MSGSRNFRRSLRASAPRVVKPLSLREEDGVKILECHVDGYPRPEIRWEKSGKPVGKSRKIHMVRSGEMCLLQIRMAQSEDSGLYSCIASNIVGTASTHFKLSVTPQTSVKRANGSATATLGPIKTTGLRSRSMDRSRESLDRKQNGGCSAVSSGTRSRSASRSSRKDVPENNTKSKLSNLTNGIWKRRSSKQHSQNLEVVSPGKKELSVSLEDCRKSRKNFLNKVRVPEIFITQKQDSMSCRGNVKGKTSTTLIAEKKSKSDRGSDAKRTNGSAVHQSLSVRSVKNCSIKCETINPEPLKNGLVKKDSMKDRGPSDLNVPKPGGNKQSKPKNKISSYLKFFENADPTAKLKEPLTERGGSLKVIKNERNKELNNSDQTDSESFFNFGKFMRRKSCESGKRSPEVIGVSTFKSHLSKDFHSNEELDNVNVNNSSNSSKNSLSARSDGEICVVNGKSGTNQQEENVPILPDITGYNLICDSAENEGFSSDTCAKQILEKDGMMELRIQSGSLGKENCPSETVTIVDDEKSDSKDDSCLEKSQLGDVNESITSRNHEGIPTIFIDEIEESEDREIVEINGGVVKEEEFRRVDEEEAQIHLSSSEQPCEGKISYSTPLIQEKCEDLLEIVTRRESLASDLQRVSSPVESPARIVKGPQSVTVLRGESVTLAIGFTGEPVPNVLWMKGGRVLQCCEDGRLSILEGREMSVVTVNEVTADDSGKYVVCVENEGGGDSRFASVAVVGYPEPPGGEPTASEFTDHSLVLSWYGSMYDGGSVVTGYQVEMCTLPDQKWHKVTSCVNTSCTVQGLSMGQRYVFRVKAENKYGLSKPSKESKMICLNDFLQYDTSSDEEPEDVLENSVIVEDGASFAERFDLKEEVGKGKFGIVYRCVDLSCGRPRAAKVIRCLKMKDKEKVRQEIEIMGRLHHPKLMQVLAAFESGRNMIMVMEFISGGELFERVIADDFVLTEHDCILFMKQICDGVTYMHRNDILHLDLKPENILCKTRTSHKIKIIDFGLARVYKPEADLRILFGTPEFVAPEVLNYEPVSPASDMWSVGVICYVLLSGLSPFMGDNDTETFANITRGEMDFDDEAFDDISQDAKDFISGLLVKKIKDRMSAEECLKHSWLATARLVQKRPLSTEKLKRFIIRRKWQKSGTAIRALGRMVSLSRSSLGSSCDSYSPLGSPTSSRSRSSLVSRSETAESGDSEVFSR